MPTAKLTDAMCRRAAPRERAYSLFDGHGLALWVSTTGARSWRWHFRLDGRPQTRSLGPYPEVPLAAARAECLRLRGELRAGSLTAGRRVASALTLRDACQQYWAGRQDCSAGYRANALRALELHAWPALGDTPVDQLTRAALMDALKRLDAAGRAEYVRKVRVWVSQVLAWAVERGDAPSNVAADIKPDRAFSRRTVEHHASLDLREIGALWARLRLEGATQSAVACRLLALTWVRTTELRMMRWDELDGDLWRLPKGRMKRRMDHLVPLSRQALEIVEHMRERRGESDYVFQAPHRADRPMSENAILYLLHRMGYAGRMTGHGWRTAGSTWANEASFPPDAIERQLAHVPNDVRHVYNRAEYLDTRRAMLQQWAEWLDAEGDASGRL